MISRAIGTAILVTLLFLPVHASDWWRESEAPGPGSTALDQKVVNMDSHDAYRINWVDEYIEVMAGATVDEKRAVNQAHAVSIAKKTARHLAYEKLAETVAGIRITGDATYDRELMLDANLKTSVQAFIRGAMVVSEKVTHYPDGSIWAEVVLGVHLNGDKGLGGPTTRWVIAKQDQGHYFTDEDAKQAESAPATAEEAVTRMEEAVAEAKQALRDEKESQAQAAKEKQLRDLQKDAEAALAKADIETAEEKVEEIRSMALPAPDPATPGKQALSTEHLTDPGYKARFTGLVVDARGLGAQPAMAPRLVTGDGKVVYGPALVDAKTMEKIGIVGYAPDFDKAKKLKRVGKKPLVIRATGLAGDNSSDLVISRETAALVHATMKAKKLFKKCAVVLVLD